MRSISIRLLLTALFGVLAVAGLALAAVSSTGSLGTPRTQATATALPGGASTQTVLVAGGYDAAGAPLATAERYDVTAGTWAPAASMAAVRARHHAVLLPTGGVLVVGGITIRGTFQQTPERYDPTTNTWDPGTAMPTTARINETVNVVTGRAGATEVIVAGGQSPTPATLNSVATYTPATEVWSTTPSMVGERSSHAAVTLPDGRLLVAGGLNGNGGPIATTEIYDPIARVWSPGPPMASPRAGHTLSVVDGTHILAAGGIGVAGGPALATAESYNPTTNTWTPAGSMAVARTAQQATVVRSGWVVMTGGTNAASPGGLDSAESWTPANAWGGLDNVPGSTAIGGPRVTHVAAAIPQSDQVLIAGGGLLPGAGPGTVTASATRWTPDRLVVPPTTAPSTPPTPTPTPTTPLAAVVPVQNRSLVATKVSGDVFVRIGKTDEYRELLPGEPVPVGTVLDTSDGRVQLVAAIGGGQQTAWFWGGTFTVLQPKGQAGYVEIRLFGKPVCKKASKKATRLVKRKKKPRVWGDGKGKFRTKGANSSASVNGTKWLVEERCTGTFTKVTRGKVTVRDFPKHKTVIVKAGKNYLARPPRR